MAGNTIQRIRFNQFFFFFVMQWHYLDLATERIRDAGRGRGRGRIVRRGLRKPARPSPADRKWEGVASARTARWTNRPRSCPLQEPCVQTKDTQHAVTWMTLQKIKNKIKKTCFYVMFTKFGVDDEEWLSYLFRLRHIRPWSRYRSQVQAWSRCSLNAVICYQVWKLNKINTATIGMLSIQVASLQGKETLLFRVSLKAIISRLSMFNFLEEKLQIK